MSATMRHRQRGGTTKLYAQKWMTNSTNGAIQLAQTTDADAGTVETMTDWVSKPFIPGRTIVNTGLYSVKRTYSASPASGTSKLTQYPGYDGWDGVNGQIYHDRTSVLDSIETQLFGQFDIDALVSQACTTALANVRKPEISGLVSLKEFKQTVDSLIHPVNGALNWLKRNAPTKQRRTRKNTYKEMLRTSKDVADQHLTVVFGIMPFISDIQGILKALEKTEPLPVRMTSHGTASSFELYTSNGEEVIYNDGNNVVKLSHSEEARGTVSVRAYQLYESAVDLQDALGLSVSDIPKALWQTATLSFVVDWFANVSNFISALTPRVGVNYIDSGYVITRTASVISNYAETGTHSDTYGWSSNYVGGTQSRVVVTKHRVPSSLFSHVGLTLRRNMHYGSLDTFRITAGLSLITQRLSKLAS